MEVGVTTGPFLMVLLLSVTLPCAAALEDGRIGVLYISDPVRSPGFDFMRSEPVFSLGFVAASLRGFGGWELDDVRRAIRLYFPRSYASLVESYDVIVLDNANRNALSPSQIEMLASAVQGGGLGLAMTGGWESFGGTGTNEPPWGDTAVGKLLPTRDVENTWVEGGHVVIDDWDNEFVSSIPWDRPSPFMRSWHHNIVTLKEGAHLLAHTDRNGLKYGSAEHPLLVTWELPVGARVLACTAEVSLMAITLSYGGVNYVPWDYYGDFTSNLMIYLAKRPVPQDVDLVHEARSRAMETRTRRSMLVALLDFIERFGANTNKLTEKIAEMDAIMASARQAYINLDFARVSERYGRALGALQGIEQQALVLKERTVLWVFVIEWACVSSTLLIGGFVIWTLMVRRRLYRAAGVTRLV